LVEFYALALPRQVSSATTLEYFSRHLSAQQRDALLLTPDKIFARLPQAEALEQFPETARLNSLQVPVAYRFAPGERDDGASLNIPLLALPSLRRETIDAAIPGLALPRIEALLRALPKEARRTLIPIGESAANFLAEQGAAAADLGRLKQWLQQSRGVAESLLRFDSSVVPAHLSPRLAVVLDEKVIARGSHLPELRRRCAAAGRTELDARANQTYGLLGPWRRFELERLPDEVALPLGQGSITVFPTVARLDRGLLVRYEWSAPEAVRSWQEASTRLARLVLERQSRDLAKQLAGNSSLLLAASPYMSSDELIDTLLQLSFARACFGDAPAPRERNAFERAVDSGRERLYSSLDEVVAAAQAWFAEAGTVRHTIDQLGTKATPDLVEETRQHLKQLLDPKILIALSPDWLRQYPRYLKAELRRWQRTLARGSEPPAVLHELNEWSSRMRDVRLRLAAELRWWPQLDELQQWLEEFRVSLYAQELKTLGPISATRLHQRIAEIDAWLQR
jgi:ATP-dependent helicase HrpA